MKTKPSFVLNKNCELKSNRSNMLLLSAMALDMADTSSSGTTIDTNDVVQQISTGTYDNGTYKLSNGFNGGFGGFGDWTFEQCLSWQRPPHHLYFQLANALFFIAFLAPCGSYGLLCSRCALVIGSILMTMWGYLIECTADVVVWSGSFLVINVVYLIVLLYRLRPIRFEKEIESVSII